VHSEAKHCPHSEIFAVKASKLASLTQTEIAADSAQAAGRISKALPA
jgi:hypothetical protein